MSLLPFDGLIAILVVPLIAAVVLIALPGYKSTARLNVLACLLTFVFAVSLVFERPAVGTLLFVDDLSVVFVILNALVGLTTSIFSASYIAHELDTGKLNSIYVRFYHATYQIMMFAMNLALISNNVGLMWVAVEMATLTTVLMVGIYRTPEALEANGDTDHCPDGGYLPDTRGARGSLEIFHFGKCGYRTCVVRHHLVLHRSGAGYWSGS